MGEDVRRVRRPRKCGVGSEWLSVRHPRKKGKKLVHFRCHPNMPRPHSQEIIEMWVLARMRWVDHLIQMLCMWSQEPGRGDHWLRLLHMLLDGDDDFDREWARELDDSLHFGVE